MHSAMMELGDGSFAAAWNWREDGEEQLEEVIGLQQAKVAAK